MENSDTKHNGNGLGNGFLLGVIVGVLLTLLFTTNRGRQIVKEMMEKGVKKFSDLEEILREPDDVAMEEDFDEDNDFIPTEPIASVEVQNDKKTAEVKLIDEKKQKEVTVVQQSVKNTVQQQTVKEKESVSPNGVQAHTPDKPKQTTGKRWFRRGQRNKN